MTDGKKKKRLTKTRKKRKERANTVEFREVKGGKENRGKKGVTNRWRRREERKRKAVHYSDESR